jgi:hypothetical protein
LTAAVLKAQPAPFSWWSGGRLVNDEREQVSACAPVAKQRLRGIFIPTFDMNYRIQTTGSFVLCFYTEKCVIEVENIFLDAT